GSRPNWRPANRASAVWLIQEWSEFFFGTRMDVFWMPTIFFSGWLLYPGGVEAGRTPVGENHAARVRTAGPGGFVGNRARRCVHSIREGIHTERRHAVSSAARGCLPRSYYR